MTNSDTHIMGTLLYFLYGVFRVGFQGTGEGNKPGKHEVLLHITSTQLPYLLREDKLFSFKLFTAENM